MNFDGSFTMNDTYCFHKKSQYEHADQTLQKLPLIILGYNLNGSYTLLQDFLRAHPKHKIFFVNCNFDQSQKNNMESFLINSNQKWLDFIYNIYKTEIRK